jgi:CheY-like chemotaxis protein
MKKLPQPSRFPRALGGRPRLLYIEDNDENWQVAELRLKRSYELVRAADDMAACHVLSQPGDLYAILMDIELRGSNLNGIALTKLLRGSLPAVQCPTYARTVPRLDVPVFFVTAYSGTAHTREELLAVGANDVLSKPVDFTKLNLALTSLYLNRVLTR